MKIAKPILCPKCKKKTVYGDDNTNRPFCSALCKLQDIGAWAYEEYRVGGEYASPEDLFEHMNKAEDESFH